MLTFAYEKPESLEQALKLLEGGNNARVMAGGTDLVLKLKHRQLKPGLVVGIGRIKELQYLTEKEGSIYIGAGVKINELLNSSLLKDRAPLLLRAAKEIGSPEIRNMATIGGNICSVKANCGACGLPGCRSMSGGGVGPCKYASHADLIPPLMALDAGLVLVGSQGERNIPLQEFALGDKKINLKAGEILKEIYFKAQDNSGWGYSRLSTAKAMGIAAISVAVTLQKNEDNTCSAISLAIGGSFRKPVKVDRIQQLIENKYINEDIIEKIIHTCIEQLEYTENLYMSVDYRRAMTGVLIKEAIQQALGAQT
ncbi:xanthine dehydrogenase family protein subunit M [Desulfallas sp. Bu1-1]|uniref:FAD binding domain-containing protein n=1 Tax=Desulfallas sp. Bu1-1 TaxID=2787620 RepID=UPI00189CFB33|nr:xanthine dehydrogenase family protein subunit M [Desulfallas sp. Bu1-1]MBF7084465.1 xanthine dehydrogenase family protein subunit M [Desulfallas sp. Bu1-1]